MAMPNNNRPSPSKMNLAKLPPGGIYDEVRARMNSFASLCVTVCEFRFGGGFADYLRMIDGAAVGVNEAKKVGTSLTGVDLQRQNHIEGLHSTTATSEKPQPFAYASTGVELLLLLQTVVELVFRGVRDPDARIRFVFQYACDRLST